MLVLTRKSQQQICIGNDITVTILKVKGKSVRVGIEAPSGVTIVRKEVADRMPRETADNEAFDFLPAEAGYDPEEEAEASIDPPRDGEVGRMMRVVAEACLEVEAATVGYR